jgi:hypothetical protein
VEKGSNAKEAGAYAIEHRVGSEFSLRIVFWPDDLRVKKKKDPRMSL